MTSFVGSVAGIFTFGFGSAVGLMVAAGAGASVVAKTDVDVGAPLDAGFVVVVTLLQAATNKVEVRASAEAPRQERKNMGHDRSRGDPNSVLHLRVLGRKSGLRSRAGEGIALPV
jgi:hypothetical protein